MGVEVTVSQARYMKWKNNQTFRASDELSYVLPLCPFKMFGLNYLFSCFSLAWYTTCLVTDCEPSCFHSAQGKKRDLLKMRVPVLWLISFFIITEGADGILGVSWHRSHFSCRPPLLSRLALLESINL